MVQMNGIKGLLEAYTQRQRRAAHTPGVDNSRENYEGVRGETTKEEAFEGCSLIGVGRFTSS